MVTELHFKFSSSQGQLILYHSGRIGYNSHYYCRLVHAAFHTVGYFTASECSNIHITSLLFWRRDRDILGCMWSQLETMSSHKSYRFMTPAGTHYFTDSWGWLKLFWILSCSCFNFSFLFLLSCQHLTTYDTILDVRCHSSCAKHSRVSLSYTP